MRICAGTYAGHILPVSDSTQQPTASFQVIAQDPKPEDGQDLTPTANECLHHGCIRPARTDGTYAGTIPPRVK